MRKYFSVFCFSLGISICSSQTFYRGVDLSYVNELEDCGVTYFDASGDVADAYELFDNQGANIVRLRLWHNPAWTNYSNLSDVKKSIKRAKDSGMEVLLDFHYSDFWTDPGRNWRPAAWEAIDDDLVLADSLYNYTYNTLKELYDEALFPEMVQVGNETNGNILIKRGAANIDGSTPGLYPINWDRQVILFKKALEAVQDIETLTQQEVQTIVHVADAASADSWFSAAHENDLNNYDIIGLSYYPQFHDDPLRTVGERVASLKEKFQKEVMLVELGLPWTTGSSGDNANNVLGQGSKLSTYDNFSPEVQKEFLTELTWLVKENGGLGVIYWEPAWVSSSCETYWGTGSHWDNATFFDFDNKAHAGMEFLSYDYAQKPEGLKEKEVTFRVNMGGEEIGNGVYVTGDFTSETWTFIEMVNIEEDIYEVTTPIAGRSSGAFVYYKNNDWDFEYREEVPSSCAFYWNTHRSFLVKNEPVNYDFAWGSCDNVVKVIVPPLQSDEMLNDKNISVFPNPTTDLLFIDYEGEIEHMTLFNAAGKQLPIQSQHHAIHLKNLPQGIYFLRLSTDLGSQSIKILKND